MARKKAPAGALLKRGLGPNFIAQWREYRDDISQERLADRVAELLGTSFSASQLSRIETSKSPYTQRTLEALAEALSCAPADLLMRNPLEKDAPWSLLDRLKPETLSRAVDLIRLLKLQEDQAA